MKREELKEILDREDVNTHVYDLSGDWLPGEKLVMEREDDKWWVYYSERGIKSNPKELETEDDACAYMLEVLLRDPGTRTKWLAQHRPPRPGPPGNGSGRGMAAEETLAGAAPMGGTEALAGGALEVESLWAETGGSAWIGEALDSSASSPGGIVSQYIGAGGAAAIGASWVSGVIVGAKSIKGAGLKAHPGPRMAGPETVWTGRQSGDGLVVAGISW